MSNIQKATFGAGCFWGVEKFFKKQFAHGLISTVVGYAGGHKPNPTYREVCTGTTGHAEALQMQYDANKIKYADLVEFFFRMHDPTTKNRQGNDVGTQYRSVIFYHNLEQKQIAEEVKAKVQDRYPDPIVTEIVQFTNWYDAEDYHQNYLEKNPNGYCNHRLRW
eukprot:GEZU01035700.1.p2 GENE.GEZU01035700.1~~GEZU01035700.1.p2  ORF type:complete len:164 (+),score=37.23 GEZU01035700.1:50-541(+)